jgi:diacylglycerol kinase (ATP)
MSTAAQEIVHPVGSPARRPAWRQRLVQAERGLAWGLRADSVFFVHFFGISIVLVAGLILGLELWQWVAITVALTVVLSAEMFQQALKLLVRGLGPAAGQETTRALSIGTAAVLVACLGSSTVVGLVFAARACELFSN